MKLTTTAPFGAILSVIIAGQALAANDTVSIGAFSLGQLDAWESKEFEGATHYRLVEDNNRKVLFADSQSSASGLFRTLRVDLDKTPYLNWSWRIENTLGNLDEKSKSGDDYAARIYVVSGGGWAFWRSRAINYVWANTSSPGSVWPNPFAGNSAVMFAVRSGNAGIGKWQTEKRNVRADIDKQFETPVRYIDAIAIMTDSDNSKRSATAYYGDIYFSKE